MGGDGDSTIKIIDLESRKLAATIPTEAEKRRAYDGPLAIGADLTRFVVTDGDVRAQHWDSARQGYPG
jgi:hypothetical protein